MTGRKEFNDAAWELFTFITEAWPDTDEQEDNFNDLYREKSSRCMGIFIEQYDRERGNGLPLTFWYRDDKIWRRNA